MKHAFKAWIDDFSIHKQSESKLLDALGGFFTICAKYNLRLSAKKCVIYTKRVKWCGCVTDSDGHQLDPSSMKAIRQMGAPIITSRLCQFIHCCRLMSTCIPDFHWKVQPLNDQLENAYFKAVKHKKSALKSIMLHKLSWSADHKKVLAATPDSSGESVKFSFPNQDHVICVYRCIRITVGICDIEDGSRSPGKPHGRSATRTVSIPWRKNHRGTENLDQIWERIIRFGSDISQNGLLIMGSKANTCVHRPQKRIICVCSISPPTKLTTARFIQSPQVGHTSI